MLGYMLYTRPAILEYVLTRSERFENMLRGGRRNSLGRTLEVVDIVIHDKQALADLFACYHSGDSTVRLRVSNALKRIFRQHPGWFTEYVDAFQALIPTLHQPSAEWTLAQLHTQFFDALTVEQKKVAVEISKKQLEHSNDWIVMIQTISFLEKVAKADKRLIDWLVKRLERISNDERKAVRVKALRTITSLKQ